jgi:hypothetical protein
MISKIQLLGIAVLMLPLFSCSQTPKHDPFDELLDRMNQNMERGVPQQPNDDSLQPDANGEYHYFSPDSSTQYHIRIDTSGNGFSRSFRFQFGPGGQGFDGGGSEQAMPDQFKEMEEMMRQMEEMQRQFFGNSPFGFDPFGGGRQRLPLFEEPLTPEEQQELRQQEEYLSDSPTGEDDLLPEERMRMEEEQPAKSLQNDPHQQRLQGEKKPTQEQPTPVKRKFKTTKI